MAGRGGPEDYTAFRYRKELKKISDKYKYVVIDTPPSLRTETVLGLVAADVIIIPARLEKMDTRAIDFTIDKTLNQIKEDFNSTLQNIYILPTQYRSVHVCLL